MRKPKKQSARTNRRDKVKLPRTFEGKAIPKHPFLIGMAYVKKLHPTLSRRRFAAKVLGVSSQALHEWERNCTVRTKTNHGRFRDFKIPAERVADLCRAFGQPPYIYRPDVFERGWRITVKKQVSL